METIMLIEKGVNAGKKYDYGERLLYRDLIPYVLLARTL